MKVSAKVVFFAMMLLTNVISRPLTAGAEIFTGTNCPGGHTDFTLTIASGETALRMTVPKSGDVGSHILLKYGTPLADDTDYQYSSRIDNGDNILDLDPPDLIAGTWYVRILTPVTASGPHDFTLVKDTGTAARPVNQPDAFVNLNASLAGNGDIYYRIDPTEPGKGWRIVLSGNETSRIELRAGYPTDGTPIASSDNQTLHTLLISPEQLTGAPPYYIHIHAYSPLTYSLTSDPAYFHDLSWDPGTSLAGTNVVSQPDSAGGDYLFRIIAQAPLHPAWRTVLNVASGEADIYLQKDSPPLGGGWYSSTNVGSDAIYVGADESLAGQTWYIRVHATPGAAWQLLSGDLFVQDLTWDDGSVPGGTNAIVQPSTAAGEYFFRITSRTPANGAWRTVLNVTGGEAGFYLQQNTPALGDTNYMSTRAGSDGLVLENSQFGGNQSWYIRVHAGADATWNIFSGDIYAQDLGALVDTSSNPSATIGPEGTYYFKTSVDSDTLAWRLWLNGLNLPLYVRKSTAPVKSPWTEVAEQYETGQMLVVPPYLTNSVYFIAVNGAPGTSFTLDSRKQPILVPSTLAGFTADEAGKEAFAFTLAGQGNGGGYGYITYRIDVPLEQIAWQVNVTPGTLDQNPEFYLRKGDVPNRWQNDGLSEAPAGVVDSITQVPPTLTNGAWYVTVYGTGTFSFSLKSGNPVITPAYYINTPDPQLPAGYAFPYSTAALQNGSSFENQSGWRYYQVSDIGSQLGFLGWQLDLTGQKPGSEIALRRNAVPARWRYRNGGSDYNTYVSNAYHVDASSILGFLQHPNHQADIWYIGIYTPDEALGPFTLATREIPAPSKPLSGSFTVAGQNTTVWQWVKFTVPSNDNPVNAAYEPDFLGWDLRLKVTSGKARLVVRRDQLPGDFTGDYNPYTRSDWPSGWQWSQPIGGDWSGRPDGDGNSYLIMGMGSPLEAGTYYVGVSGDGSSATPLSYTLESRAIGIGSDAQGNPWPIQVKDISFSGEGSVQSGTELQPREAAYYRVAVPEGTKSWSVKLEPTTGEAMLAIRHGRLPNNAYSNGSNQTGWFWSPAADDANNFQGTRRQKNGREFFYKFPQDVQPPQTTITAGTYYIAVISEGQNPPNNTTAGTGGVSYTLTSDGEMPISDRTAAPVSEMNLVTWAGESLHYAENRIYRVRVAEGLRAIEIRLKNRVGNPGMAVRQDPAGEGRVPGYWYHNWYGRMPNFPYAASEGGFLDGWQHNEIVTIPNPSGDYTIMVGTNQVGTADTDAAYDLEIRAISPLPLDLTGANATASGLLIDQQVTYYRVTVPDTYNGYPIVGWKLRQETTSGSTAIRMRKEGIPTGNYDDFSSSNRFSVITPPILAPGEWFIEVRASGLSNYTITSDIISPDPSQHRRTWAMPAKTGTIESCSDAAANVLIGAPYIGDSGITAPDAISGQCAEIINPTTGDLGTDLADGDWHFYRVTVPDGNTGLLRTVVEALSGKPELYIRRDYAPTVDQYFTNEDGQGTFLAHRIQSYSGTMYGNWVPLNGRTETQLTPGDWWLGVRASGTNVRYRLKVSVGDVLDDAGQRQDKDGYVQDLALDGGQKTGQTLAAGDMRYYKLSMPASDLNQANSTPLSWNINLNQQVGDVLVFVRDTIPPGRGTNGNTTDPNAFQDWSDDTNSLAPLTTTFIDIPGNYTFSLPPVEPGKTYFLGVYAKSDAAFDIASTIGSERLELAGILDFYDGSVSRTLAAGGQAVYRIDVPADAMRWRHTAQHTSEVKLYLLQDSVPRGNPQVDHWASCDWYGNNCATNSSFSKYLYESSYLNNYPWQPGHSYYLLAVNTAAGTQPFTFTMDGRNPAGDDENQNGIPDWWEWNFFRGLWYGAESDPDGDGLSNLKEYQLGTDPTKPELIKTTITSPVDGVPLTGHPLTITGTAEIGAYGTISLVEVSLDGWSWMSATDTSANGSWATWSFPFTPNGTDWRYTIQSRATASTGNQERVPPSVTVTDSRFFFLYAEVSPANAGAISQPGGPYFDGSIVSISANPAQCFDFDHWSGDATGSDNPLTIEMDRIKSVTAHFAAKGPQPLTVHVNNPEGGNVSPQSGDITCGQTVRLAATPAAGYTFTGWDGDVTGMMNPLDVTMDRPMTLTANFQVMKPGDIVTVAGNGADRYDGDGGLALHAGVGGPVGVSLGAGGNLYITERNRHVVRKVSPDGNITTIAGTGTAGYSGDGGPAISALLNQPCGVAVDGTGAVYIADLGNNVIRKISPGGASITTVAGNGTAGYSGDGGPATAAQMNGPVGIALDDSGHIYVAERQNHVVRKIDNSGNVSTVAGNGTAGYSGDDGPAAEAQLNAPQWVTVDKAGRLFISDYFNNVIRMVDTHGIITTYAGSGTWGYSGDGGPATAANLAYPMGLAVDGADNLYVTDGDYYQVLRRIDKNGVITTLAGRGGYYGYWGDGGPAASAYLASPHGIAIDTNGNLYLADTNNNRVRMVVGPGSIVINGNAETSDGPDVTLTLWASDKDGLDKMRFSDDGTTWTDPEPYDSIKQWKLADGFGMKTVYFQFNDTLGNWSPLMSASINDTKDLIPPTSTITQPSDGALLSGNFYVITGTVSDVGYGPYKVEVSSDGGANWQDVWYYWYGGTAWNYYWSLPADGSYTLLSRATDTAWNVETVGTGVMITVDNTPPTTTANPAGGTYSSAQNVILSANEQATIYYTTDGNDPTESSSVYSSAPIAIAATTTLKFFAKDTAGNPEAVKTQAYTIDTSGPSGSIAISGGIARTNGTLLTLDLSAADAAGVTQMQFSSDGTTWSAAEAYAATKSWTLTAGDGVKTIYVKFKDGVGNWSNAYTVTVTLDTTAPVTTASPVGGTYGSVQNVTLSANEQGTIYYTTDGNDPIESSSSYSAPIPIAATTTLKFFAKDLAGNKESVRTQLYNIISIIEGDLNGDGVVDLIDAILAMQVISNIAPAQTIHKEADANNDGRIGVEEVIYILQSVAGMRPKQ